jgi:hypothetical protein
MLVFTAAVIESIRLVALLGMFAAFQNLFFKFTFSYHYSGYISHVRVCFLSLCFDVITLRISVHVE